MRYRLPALAVLALAAAAPAQGANRNFGVSGFEQIRVQGPFKVTVEVGVPPYARATGSPAALDTVQVEMQGRTLIVRPNRSSWGGYPGRSDGPVEVLIGTHELSRVGVIGAGSIIIDKVKGPSFDLAIDGSGSAQIGAVTVDRLKVNMFGAATARLGGTAAMFDGVVRGAGALDALELGVKDAKIGAEGTVSVSATVTGTAKVQAQGPAVVNFAGRPACETKASGSASVNGCR